jgi:cytochrome c biogenesis protein CcmG, thiol:disulfide interchange protein DsbE
MSRAHPRRMTALWSAVAVAVAAVSLVAVLATRGAAQNAIATSALEGKIAPPITGRSLSGTPVSLSALRGRYVVINFFASWCQPCQVEEPQLVEFARAHARAGGATILGVVFGDSATNAAAFDKSNGATWPAVNDPGGRLAVEYGVEDPPETFLVSPDGRIVAKVDGSVTAQLLDQLITESGTGSQ